MDLQTKRKDMIPANANENRFLTLDPFPPSLSTVTHKRQVKFQKQLPREYANKFYDIKMSDSLYKSEDRDVIRPNAKYGTLQFGQSTLNRKGTGLTQRPVREEIMHIGKDTIKIPDPSQFPVSFSMPAKTAPQTSRRNKGKIQGPDYLPNMFSLDKQLPRIPDEFTPNTERMLMQETLPGHMHHQSNRLAAEQAHSKTIRDRNYQNTEF